VSNFDQMATAKECMQLLGIRTQEAPCRKQISSDTTKETNAFGLLRQNRRVQAEFG
jgi:hypothetical protein